MLHPDATFAKAPSVEVVALVIGGGATTRSACQALFLMGVEQIYLVNRDVDEANKGRGFLPILIHAAAEIEYSRERAPSSEDPASSVMCPGAKHPWEGVRPAPPHSRYALSEPGIPYRLSLWLIFP